MPIVAPRGLCLPGIVLCCALVAPAAAAERTGSVSGLVHFDPAASIALPTRYRSPTRKPILAPDPARAIVYLEALAHPATGDPADQPVEVAQEGYQFRPGIVAVRVGTRVAFPNRDDEFHSVFSYSRVKRFDLGRFRRDEVSPLVTFDTPGLVKVYCEIHKHMRAFVLVLETPWFTATDRDGAFELREIPPGEYRVRALLPDAQTREGQVTIVAGQTTRVTFGP